MVEVVVEYETGLVCVEIVTMFTGVEVVDIAFVVSGLEIVGEDERQVELVAISVMVGT